MEGEPIVQEPGSPPFENSKSPDPTTPIRPPQELQGIKSPWWQCLSPLDPGISVNKSPNVPNFQRSIGVEESPSNTRISPNTLKRALGGCLARSLPTPTDSSLARAIYEDLNSYGRQAKRRLMQKLDFSCNTGNQEAPHAQETSLKVTLDASLHTECTNNSMPPQNPLNWSPRSFAGSKRKAIWSSMAYRRNNLLSPPSSLSSLSSTYPTKPPDYELTSASPPFDPSVPPVSSSSPDLAAPCPSPVESSSTGGEPARIQSSSPFLRASRRSTSRSGGRPRAPDTTSGSTNKSCNCKKSKCLKLYCECFARQGYCKNCNCTGCNNIPEFEEARQKAIFVTLERDPNAFFRAKTGSVDTFTSKHRRGCHCKKSECLKKYCECFQAGVPCADICKCTDCRNGKEHGDAHGRKSSSSRTVRKKKDTVRNRAVRVLDR